MGIEMSSGARKRIVVLASGEGSVAQSLFDAVAPEDGLLHQRIEIERVVTENPEAGILRRANKAGLKTSIIEFRPGVERGAWERELHRTVSDVNPWLVVSAGFMKILAPTFVNEFQTINTHPSLLPLFPGAHAVRDALAAGALESGCTLHFVDEGVDTGPIIAQRKLQVRPGESERELHSRIKELERELIITGILQLLEREQ